jgi:hypothetical protein
MTAPLHPDLAGVPPDAETFWCSIIEPDGEPIGVVAGEIARDVPDWQDYVARHYGPGCTVVAGDSLGDALRNMRDAAIAKQTQEYFRKLYHDAGLLPRPDPEIEAARKEAWIREVKEAWRPSWTPEMEMIYGWRESRKKPKSPRRGGRGLRQGTFSGTHHVTTKEEVGRLRRHEVKA